MGAFWGVLEAFWRRLGRLVASWGVLERLGTANIKTFNVRLKMLVYEGFNEVPRGGAARPAAGFRSVKRNEGTDGQVGRVEGLR